MTLLLDRPDVQVHHASWEELLAVLPRQKDGTVCDLLCVDAPYSAKTHAGHDSGVLQTDFYNGAPSKRTHRTKLRYGAWSPDDVERFVAAWAPVTRGWIVSLTDHVLAPAWAAAMEAAGRYVFSPLACVNPGSRVRLSGDGPTQWSVWAVVSRPRTQLYARWGSLPGAYVVPAGAGARELVGGKPLWLLERLLEDYSRAGELVCDPCCGAGTTLLAALQTGRRAIGGDVDEKHAALAARTLDRQVQLPLLATPPAAASTAAELDP